VDFYIAQVGKMNLVGKIPQDLTDRIDAFAIEHPPPSGGVIWAKKVDKDLTMIEKQCARA
jgi:hypothetical protein